MGFISCHPERGRHSDLVIAIGLLLCARVAFAVSPACNSRWAADPSRLGANGVVRTLLTSPDGLTLYAGGEFTGIGGISANKVARLDANGWAPLGAGMNGTVWTLAFVDLGSGPMLYAGGDFTTADGASAPHLARWEDDRWVPISGGTDGGVYAITTHTVGGHPQLVAGGMFYHAGSIAAKSIARWDGTAWSPLGSGLSNSPSPIPPIVRALAVYDAGTGPQLYAAGLFTSPGKNIACWNGTSWSALGKGASNTINAMLVAPGDAGNLLYVAGMFISAGDVPNARRIAAWNGTTWLALAQGMEDTQVNALAEFHDADGDRLYAAGQFAAASGMETRRIARWDGATWTPVGSGLLDDISDPCWCGLANCDCGPRPAVVFAMTAYGAALWTGGDFVRAGCSEPHNIARWSCQPSGTVAADFDWDGTVGLLDFEFLQQCATGPAVGLIAECCQPADLNADGSIDMVDFARFQRCLSPPDTPISTDCEEE